MGGKGGNCIYTGMLTPNGWTSRHLFWLFFVEIVEDIVEDQVIAVLVFSLKESNIQ